MKNVFLSFLLFGGLAIAQPAVAQKSPVDEMDMSIEGIPRKGQRVIIQLDAKVVETAWLKYLTERAGKITNKKGVYYINAAMIDAISKTPMRLISRVDPTTTGTGVWWSLDLGNAYLGKDATPVQYREAEKYLKDFARQLYRDDIALQVLEADKAQKIAQDNHIAVIREADETKRAVERNKVRKAEIDALLSQNQAELLQLNNALEDNLKKQEAARADIVAKRVALEAVKEKVNKIE
ncbi:MAG: DNA repair ATPase [Hymenobacteraceae bacterium]|nr:DNA repair ATPase [Hymenobacteraceae bacterium]